MNAILDKISAAIDMFEEADAVFQAFLQAFDNKENIGRMERGTVLEAFIQVKVYKIMDVYVAMGRAFSALYASLRVMKHFSSYNEQNHFHSNIKNVARDMVKKQDVKGGTLMAPRIYSFRVDVETARDAVVYFLSLTVK